VPAALVRLRDVGMLNLEPERLKNRIDPSEKHVALARVAAHAECQDCFFMPESQLEVCNHGS
jgi:hypothetical protein